MKETGEKIHELINKGYEIRLSSSLTKRRIRMHAVNPFASPAIFIKESILNFRRYLKAISDSNYIEKNYFQ
jgi:hypothetical protein